MSVQRQIDDLIALQAAEWYERLKSAAPLDNQAFVSWVSESPRHMEAFLLIAASASMLKRVLNSDGFDLDALLPQTTPQVLPLPVRTRPPSVTSAECWLPRSNFRAWATAAAVATVAIITAMSLSLSSWQHFDTSIGEQRTIQLSEGSVLRLNAVSEVEVRFDKTQRRIRLRRGEATFKVAHDAVRPFRVQTRDVVVEAIGTQFNVYAHDDDTMTVSVLEGKVQVSSAHGATLPLVEGQEAHVNSKGWIERKSHADVTEAVAWQERKLVFKRTLLEDIVTEFNRYNRSMPIRLEGIERGSLRFSGAFNADDPLSLASALMREPELEVVQAADEIMIRPATATSSAVENRLD